MELEEKLSNYTKLNNMIFIIPKKEADKIITGFIAELEEYLSGAYPRVLFLGSKNENYEKACLLLSSLKDIKKEYLGDFTYPELRELITSYYPTDGSKSKSAYIFKVFLSKIDKVLSVLFERKVINLIEDYWLLELHIRAYNCMQDFYERNQFYKIINKNSIKFNINQNFEETIRKLDLYSILNGYIDHKARDIWQKSLNVYFKRIKLYVERQCDKYVAGTAASRKKMLNDVKIIGCQLNIKQNVTNSKITGFNKLINYTHSEFQNKLESDTPEESPLNLIGGFNYLEKYWHGKLVDSDELINSENPWNRRLTRYLCEDTVKKSDPNGKKELMRRF